MKPNKNRLAAYVDELNLRDYANGGFVDRDSWLLLPFGEHLLCVSIFLLLAPAVWGIYKICTGDLMFGTLLMLGWFVLFFPLAIFLHRRKIVRFVISLPGAALILSAASGLFIHISVVEACRLG